ncbi:hypothetical protein AAC387_Pa12g1397 [Persea americana]
MYLKMEEGSSPSSSSTSNLCKQVPLDVSSFVDAFVDFSVSGLFFPQNSPPTPPPQTRHPSPPRLLAIGDLHGDLDKTLQALSLSGIIDGRSLRWTGGDAVAVQLGDVLDRGSDELKLLYLLHRLKLDAERSGGSLLTLLGNHEVMNVDSDFRFATPSALREFQIWAEWFQLGNSMKSLCQGIETPQDIFRGIPRKFPGIREEFHAGFRARIAALRRNGPITKRFLSGNPVVLVVGDSIFVHGGLLPEHVDYGLDKINEEVWDWINGLGGGLSPDFLRGRNAVVWSRRFSAELEKKCDCSTLEHVLATIPGARRMIMGHTIQMAGINGVCSNRAIRVDVGMSRGCGDGLPEVLEIVGNSDGLRVLTSNPVYKRDRFDAKSKEAGDKVGLGMLFSDHGPKQVEVNA